MHDGSPGVARRVETVVETVGSWPGISVAPHRYGGTGFKLGGREIGHVHRMGAVDIAFTRRLRDRLVDERWTGTHHVYPDSGWTTMRLRADADVERALALLTLSYLYHHSALARRTTPPPIDESVRRYANGFPASVTALVDPVIEGAASHHSSAR